MNEEVHPAWLTYFEIVLHKLCEISFGQLVFHLA
jgi:hypothetical protein